MYFELNILLPLKKISTKIAAFILIAIFTAVNVKEFPDGNNSSQRIKLP
jgi:hypothetical protein